MYVIKVTLKPLNYQFNDGWQLGTKQNIRINYDT